MILEHRDGSLVVLFPSLLSIHNRYKSYNIFVKEAGQAWAELAAWTARLWSGWALVRDLAELSGVVGRLVGRNHRACVV